VVPAGFPTRILYIVLISHACYVPFPSHLAWFDDPNNIWRKVQIKDLLIKLALKSTREISHVCESKTNVSEICSVFIIRVDMVNDRTSLICIPVYQIDWHTTRPEGGVRICGHPPDSDLLPSRLTLCPWVSVILPYFGILRKTPRKQTQERYSRWSRDLKRLVFNSKLTPLIAREDLSISIRRERFKSYFLINHFSLPTSYSLSLRSSKPVLASLLENRNIFSEDKYKFFAKKLRRRILSYWTRNVISLFNLLLHDFEM
jgi:hypothetical protein